MSNNILGSTIVYRSNEYNEGVVLTTMERPPKVQVGYYVYVKSEILEWPEGRGANNMTDIVLVDTECFASKNAEYNAKTESTFKHNFIKDRCITDDKTVIIKRNGEDHLSQFNHAVYKILECRKPRGT